ncbi:hypothetical protein CRG98_042237 [Punica granatum]|uniref:Uncharacterized protein n=1 Tax=Punica granatum TaxID=22663 RepID=A0A2I0I0T1_PUNGR|nr:hypothetical protein CRG98_042237 [Punica granatum]
MPLLGTSKLKIHQGLYSKVGPSCLGGLIIGPPKPFIRPDQSKSSKENRKGKRGRGRQSAISTPPPRSLGVLHEYRRPQWRGRDRRLAAPSCESTRDFEGTGNLGGGDPDPSFYFED